MNENTRLAALFEKADHNCEGWEEGSVVRSVADRVSPTKLLMPSSFSLKLGVSWA
jgi:hypothetical protein